MRVIMHARVAIAVRAVCTGGLFRNVSTRTCTRRGYNAISRSTLIQMLASQDLGCAVSSASRCRLPIQILTAAVLARRARWAASEAVKTSALLALSTVRRARTRRRARPLARHAPSAPSAHQTGTTAQHARRASRPLADLGLPRTACRVSFAPSDNLPMRRVSVHLALQAGQHLPDHTRRAAQCRAAQTCMQLLCRQAAVALGSDRSQEQTAARRDHAATFAGAMGARVRQIRCRASTRGR